MTDPTASPQPFIRTMDDNRPERCGDMHHTLTVIRIVAETVAEHCSDYPDILLETLKEIAHTAALALARDDAMRKQAGFPDV